MKEMQTKATMSYRPAPVKMVSKMTLKTSEARMWRKWNHSLRVFVGNVNEYSHYGKPYGGSSKN
jgi:hypothetical protein